MTPPVTGRVPLPRLTSRSAVAWALATVVAALAVCGGVAATMPAQRVYAAAGAALVVLVTLALAGTRRSADVDDRSITWTRWFVVRRTVRRDEMQAVELRRNGAGVLNLAVRTGARSRALSVVARTQYVTRSLPPAALLALAAVLDGDAPPVGGAAVASQLRAQARHLEAGGAPDAGPLRGR